MYVYLDCFQSFVIKNGAKINIFVFTSLSICFLQCLLMISAKCFCYREMLLICEHKYLIITSGCCVVDGAKYPQNYSLVSFFYLEGNLSVISSLLLYKDMWNL